MAKKKAPRKKLNRLASCQQRGYQGILTKMGKNGLWKFNKAPCFSWKHTSRLRGRPKTMTILRQGKTGGFYINRGGKKVYMSNTVRRRGLRTDPRWVATRINQAGRAGQTYASWKRYNGSLADYAASS